VKLDIKKIKMEEINQILFYL